MIAMKKYIYALTAMVLLASCSPDLGNYEYVDLAEPVITGLEDQSVLSFSRLILTPTVELKNDAANYSFEWKAVDNNGLQEPVVIGNQQNLDWEVALSPGSYSLYLTITELATGLYWQEMLTLTVSSSTSEGWMVLCSEDGRARLDLVSVVTGEPVKDVLRASDMPQLNGPRRIIWLSDKTDEASPYYLCTDDGATRLGKDAFEWKPEYDFAYEVAIQDKLCPQVMVPSGFGKVIVSGTDAHYCEIMGIAGLYGSAVNKGFRVAPFVGANVLATQVYASVFLLYDIDNKRPMAYCPLLVTNDLGGLDPVADMETMGQIAEGMAPGAGVVGSAFSQWPEGYDCLYMENTRYDPGNAKMGLTYLLLADGADCHLYGIQLGDILRYADCTFVLGKGYFGDLSQCRDIMKEGAIYAFSSLKNYMYYAVGDTVYSVDLSAAPLKEKVEIVLEGEEITCMKFNLYQKEEYMSRSYDLVVATEKDGEGILRVYEGLNSEGQFGKVVPQVYEGFARIVDVCYKERLY